MRLRAIADLANVRATISYQESTKSLRVVDIDEKGTVHSYTKSGTLLVSGDSCSKSAKRTGGDFLVEKLQHRIDFNNMVGEYRALRTPTDSKLKVRETPENIAWVHQVHRLKQVCSKVEDTNLRDAFSKLKFPEQTEIPPPADAASVSSE